MIACHGLLFDMDGLMVDSEPLWFEVERAFARERGGDFTPGMARRCVGRGLAHTLAFMGSSFGFAVDLPRDSADIVGRFISRVGELSLKTGFVELFETARERRVPTAVASSSARRLVEATLGRFALLERFDAVVSGDCVPRTKPEPDIFLEAARRIGVPPRACVVLEDSPSGIRAAVAAGMAVIAVPEVHAPIDFVTATATVRDLHDARRLLAFP